MLSVLLPQLPARLPSELLTRRPDLTGFICTTARADACLDSASKLLLPRIMFTAAGGTRDQALTNLIDPNSLVWNLFAGVFQLLFTGGHIRGGITLAQARATEALHRYNETVLNAFREVEQALAAE